MSTHVWSRTSIQHPPGLGLLSVSEQRKRVCIRYIGCMRCPIEVIQSTQSLRYLLFIILCSSNTLDLSSVSHSQFASHASHSLAHSHLLDRLLQLYLPKHFSVLAATLPCIGGYLYIFVVHAGGHWPIMFELLAPTSSTVRQMCPIVMRWPR